MARRIFVEPWDPEYGSSFAGFPPDDVAPSLAEVDASVEVAAADWEPIAPRAGAGVESVVFVDGVRRIDALVWIETAGGGGGARLGLCASFAAGSLRAGETAEVVDARVRRALFTSVEGVGSLHTDSGVYSAVAASGETAGRITASVQEELRRLEDEVAGASRGSREDLLVVDGPLSSRLARPRTVGYVKTHRVAYLDSSLEPVVRGLAPSERTPLFLTTTSWSRYSCYLRLEGAKSHPWAGVVRLEVPGERPLEQAASLVDAAAATLPRFSSVPHKEPRAPQNLFPISGLERELRRRLGDHALLHRSLLRAAARTS